MWHWRNDPKHVFLACSSIPHRALEIVKLANPLLGLLLFFCKSTRELF